MAAGELLTDDDARTADDAARAPRDARRAAVVGRPVAHSLSPTLQTAAYAALGLAGWRYDAVDVGPDGLADLVTGLDRTWAGLSVTTPHKQAVMPLLHDVSDLAARVGAVNTVVVDPVAPDPGGTGDAVRLRGENTDVHGLAAALSEGGAPSVRTACVLGAGATAASALAALLRLGCASPRVVVRSRARAEALLAAAGRLGCTPVVVPWPADGDVPDVVLTCDAVVSTVPAGAADPLAQALAGRAVSGALLDAVYDPWPTRLAAAWSAAGGVVVPGLAMLLHQAAAQVELFTGRPAPLAVMRAAVGLPEPSPPHRALRQTRSGEVAGGSGPGVK